MEQTLRYRAEDFSATLPLADYLARFRDAARIGGYCRSCPRYGATWACPPFEFEVESLFEGRTRSGWRHGSPSGRVQGSPGQAKHSPTQVKARPPTRC